MTQELKPGLSPEDLKLIAGVNHSLADRIEKRGFFYGTLTGKTFSAIISAARAEGPAQPSDDGPGRVAFVRETLTRLMEENGGPHCREARIVLSGSTIAAWLLRLGGVSAASLRPTPEPQAEVRGLVEALEKLRLRYVREIRSMKEMDARGDLTDFGKDHLRWAEQIHEELAAVISTNSHQGEK